MLRTAFSEVADPVKFLLLVRFLSCGLWPWVSRGSSSFSSRSWWQAMLAGAGMESRGGGAIYVAGLVRRPRRSSALTHPSNRRVPKAHHQVQTTDYAAPGPGCGVSLARAGWYRVPSRSSA